MYAKAVETDALLSYYTSLVVLGGCVLEALDFLEFLKFATILSGMMILLLVIDCWLFLNIRIVTIIACHCKRNKVIKQGLVSRKVLEVVCYFTLLLSY